MSEAGQQTAGQAPDMLPRAEKEKPRKALPGVQAKDMASIHTGQRREKTNTRDENIPEPSCLVSAKALS